MRRREFIPLLGGAAVAAWPVAAHAQRRTISVIGFLSARSFADSADHIAAFRQGLNEVGYVEGQNVAIEFRWADGKYDRLEALASELVSRQVTVIAATGGNVSGLVAKAATATIPIVFIVGEDPVKLGLVASFNRPGGNATGMRMFTTELGVKRLSLLDQLVPRASSIGFLLNPNYPGSEPGAVAMEAAARSLGRRILVLRTSDERGIEAAFVALSRNNIGALLIDADTLFVIHRDRMVALAARHSIPTIYDLRDFVVAGGLMSYGTSLVDGYRQVGIYTGRILKGTPVTDLPVQQPTKFEFVVNLKTAKALGLSLPPIILLQATEVIE